MLEYLQAEGTAEIMEDVFSSLQTSGLYAKLPCSELFQMLFRLAKNESARSVNRHREYIPSFHSSHFYTDYKLSPSDHDSKEPDLAKAQTNCG